MLSANRSNWGRHLATIDSDARALLEANPPGDRARTLAILAAARRSNAGC